MNAHKLLELSPRNWDLRAPFALGTLSVLALVTLTVPASAGIITNGSFENTNGAASSYEIDSANLPGWTNGSGAPVALNCLVLASDVSDPCGVASFDSSDVFWTNPTLSPDGGNFIAVDSDPSFSAALSQTLTGLVVGDTYDVSFYQGAAQFKAATGNTTDLWAVTLGSETLDSAIMDDASKGVVAWESQSLDFTATSTTEVLSFFAEGTPSGGPPTALLDGVSVTGTESSPTPEPVMWAAVGTALAGFVVARRRQHRRS
jgi:hypothetical protein